MKEVNIRQHRILHLLLHKAFPQNVSLLAAANFTGKSVNSRVYENIKNKLYEKNKKRVVVYSEDESRYINIPKESYDPETHKTSMKGKVFVYDINKECDVLITVEEFRVQPTRYVHKLKNKMVVYSKCEDRYISIDKQEYLLNKSKYKSPLEGTISCIDIETGKIVRVSSEDCENNDNYIKMLEEGILVEIKETNEVSRISRTEFTKNRHLYRTATEGKVLVYDSQERKNKYVLKAEYLRLKDERYVSNTKNKVVVYDSVEGVRKHVTKDDYYSNPLRYKTINKNTTRIVDEQSGDIIRISTDAFDPAKHKRPKTNRYQYYIYDINDKLVAIVDGNIKEYCEENNVSMNEIYRSIKDPDYRFYSSTKAATNRALKKGRQRYIGGYVIKRDVHV